MKQLREIIEKGKRWIPKTSDKRLKKFENIIPEITLTNNGILLKSERVILPENLQQKAIELAYRGSHPGQSGIARRLRYHFFFHNMQEKVSAFVNNCRDCAVFTNKKTTEPLLSQKVPRKN